MIDLSVNERIGIFLPVPRAHDEALGAHMFGQARLPLDHPGARARGLPGVLGQPVDRLGIHVKTTAFARRQETLGDQRLIGQRDRVARYAEAARHGAGRGHRLARQQLTGADCRHKNLAYLGLQGRRLRPFEMNVACPFPPIWHYCRTNLCP
jgi:hypothetical protein